MPALYRQKQKRSNRQRNRRIDLYEIIVLERSGTFQHYFVQGGLQVTSIELKHKARLQEWGSAIKECRSSGQSVREWCRQQGITPTTYYRWEREVLSVADSMAQQDGQERVTFAKVPVPRQEYQNEAKHSATLYAGNVRIDIYPSCGREQLKTLIEMLHTC